jgi:acetoin utilization deacetylase AcuC-like enzyme
VKVVFSEEHRQHFPQANWMGEFVTPFERPSRMEYVLRRLKQRGFNDITAPGRLDMKPVRKLHDRGYLTFLRTAWDQWIAEGGRGEIIPTSFPMRRMQQRVPSHIDGKAGYYTLAVETAITAGTWAAAQASAAVALTAQALVAGGQAAAFALCRPPGHHAATDMYGGYCFLNNAAIAAQAFIDGGAERVAILDVDFHHGNGTQDIFYRRSDVLFCSLHGRPEDAFPYFLGYKDEVGAGEGEGFNVNYPMPPGPVSMSGAGRSTTPAAGSGASARRAGGVAGRRRLQGGPDQLLQARVGGFPHLRRPHCRLKRPTLFVMEGGYAIEAIGLNTVNVLEGFLGG